MQLLESGRPVVMRPIYPIKEGIALMYMKRQHVLAGEHFHIEKRGSVIFVQKIHEVATAMYGADFGIKSALT